MPHFTQPFETTDRDTPAVAEIVLAAVVAGAALALITLAPDAWSVDAIRSAIGKEAVTPANSPAITELLASVQGNWYWFLLGAVPLTLSILLGAVALGVRSASDWLFRLLLGIVGIIAFAPAIVA